MPDYDGDLLPGLTIKSSNGDDSGDSRRSQTWRYPLAGPLVLNGPVSLHLSSSRRRQRRGLRVPLRLHGRRRELHADRIRQRVGRLLDGLAAVGVARHLARHREPHAAAGHELRLRLYIGQGDQAVAMTGDFPSSLTLTVP